jgi:hypothetical protein
VKILLVNDYAVPQGGAEILILNLREALRARGHDARLFASNAGENSSGNLADYTCPGTTSRLRTLLQSANPCGYGAATRAGRIPARCSACADVPDTTFAAHSAATQERSQPLPCRLVSTYLSARYQTAARPKFMLLAAVSSLLSNWLFAGTRLGAADVPDETVAAVASSL